jgi:hypothetical protein
MSDDEVLWPGCGMVLECGQGLLAVHVLRDNMHRQEGDGANCSGVGELGYRSANYSVDRGCTRVGQAFAKFVSHQ